MSSRLDTLVDALDDARRVVLARAVELGKWPDGRVMEQAERDLSLQILIAYDFRYKEPGERIGYVPVPADDCDHGKTSGNVESPSLIAKS